MFGLEKKSNLEVNQFSRDKTQTAKKVFVCVCDLRAGILPDDQWLYRS